MSIKYLLHNCVESFLFSIFNCFFALIILILMIISYVKFPFLQSGLNQLFSLALMLGVSSTFIITIFKIKYDLTQK